MKNLILKVLIISISVFSSSNIFSKENLKISLDKSNSLNEMNTYLMLATNINLSSLYMSDKDSYDSGYKNFFVAQFPNLDFEISKFISYTEYENYDIVTILKSASFEKFQQIRDLSFFYKIENHKVVKKPELENYINSEEDSIINSISPQLEIFVDSIITDRQWIAVKNLIGVYEDRSYQKVFNEIKWIESTLNMNTSFKNVYLYNMPFNATASVFAFEQGKDTIMIMGCLDEYDDEFGCHYYKSELNLFEKIMYIYIDEYYRKKGIKMNSYFKYSLCQFYYKEYCKDVFPYISYKKEMKRIECLNMLTEYCEETDKLSEEFSILYKKKKKNKFQYINDKMYKKHKNEYIEN